MRKFVLLLSLFLLPIAAPAQKVPPEKELQALAQESLLAFDRAVQAKDFTEFHKYISALWRKEITPAKLQGIFQPFIDQEVTISGIADLEPIFTQSPAIEDKLLVLRGRYPTRPAKVEFQLKYVNEQKAWKLAGIRVNLTPTEAKLPSEEEASVMVRDSLLAFNNAIQKKNFTDFHKKQIAAIWRRQTTPAALLETFDSFVKAEANIAPIANMEPVFDKPPAINEDGVLSLVGHYPTKPSRVTFELGYLFEDPDWGLVQINVNVRPEGEAGDDDDE
jgi:hypothetical protein